MASPSDHPDHLAPMAGETAAAVGGGSKFIFTFNKVFADYVLLLKRVSPAVKEALKRHYRSIDNLATATEHLDWFRDAVDVDALCDAYDLNAVGVDAAATSTSSSSSDKPASLALAKGVDASMLLPKQQQQGRSPAAPETAERGALLQVMSYMCLLGCLHRLYRRSSGEEKANAAEEAAGLDGMLQSTLSVVSHMQNGGVEAREVVAAEAEEKIDDAEVKRLLGRMISYEQELQDMMLREEEEEEGQEEGGGAQQGRREGEEAAGGGGGGSSDRGGGGNFDAAFERFKESKLGRLTNELSEGLDFSKINLDNPFEMLNLANLTDPNSPLGGIVTKMGDKFRSGDVDCGEIVGEAMNMLNESGLSGSALQNIPMLNELKNNPMMAEVLKQFSSSAKNGAAGGEEASTATGSSAAPADVEANKTRSSCSSAAPEDSAAANDDGRDGNTATGSSTDAAADALERLRKSKLGNLLAEDVDLSGVNPDNPFELLDPSKLSDPRNPVRALMNKMSDKFKSGEIDGKEIIGEVMGALGAAKGGAGAGAGAGNPLQSLQNIPMMSELMNNPMMATMLNDMTRGGGGGGGVPPAPHQRQQQHSAGGARERLRRRLEARRAGGGTA